MKTRIFLIILNVTLSIIALAQWTWRNPLPQGNSLRDVYFVNPSTGYAAGRNGTILKTTDSGISWDVKHMLHVDKSGCFGLTFSDENTGYMLQGSGTIHKTTDAGQTWDILTYELPGSPGDMFFTSAQKGFIVGAGGIIISTTDGGESWSLKNTPCSDDLSSIWFVNGEVGYISGRNGQILKTVDGGNSWISIHNEPLLDLTWIHFISEMDGCTVGWYGEILNTSDGGLTWITTNFGDDFKFYTVSMFNPDTILVGGIEWGINDVPHILRSTDGGLTWTEIHVDDDYLSPLALYCMSDGTAYCVGGLGFIARSDDFGSTWTVLSRLLTEVKHWGAVIKDIDFPTSDVGYAVAGGYESPRGRVLKTIDGGDTWFELDSLFIGQALGAIRFLSPGIGFIASRNIYSTTDGGNTWMCRHTGSKKITAIDFVNSSIGVAVGTDGTFLRTVNMGQNWNQVANIPVYDYNRVCFTGPVTGYALAGSKLLKTTNTGMTWSEITLPFSLSSIFFLTTELAYGVGIYGLIVKTTDGGNSWDILNAPTTYNLQAVHFYDMDTGFVAGGGYSYSSVILKTTDGGTTWTEQDIPTINPIEDICVTSSYNVYACAEYGQLFGLKNNSGTVEIHEMSGSEPVLSKVLYPNPASGSATIRYTLTEHCTVNLIIFTISGNRLLNEYHFRQDPGKHSIIINTKDLPAGTYIYRLTTGPRSETGKIIINH